MTTLEQIRNWHRSEQRYNEAHGDESAEFHKRAADAIDAHLAKGAQEWQPIETAPKGEEILVYSPLCAGTKSVEDWGKFCKYNSPIWTHWMPLPDAPMLSQRGEVE